MGLFDVFYKNPNQDNTKEKVTPSKKVVQTPSTIKTSEFSKQSFNTSLTTNNNVPVGGVKKQEILDYFQKVFSENNFPGPDYQEFVTALEKMKSQALPEDQKFKNSFMVFETMGLTANKLIETANKYKELFKGKFEGFNEHIKVIFEEKVTAKEKEVEGINTRNLQIDEQMRQLNDQKNDNLKQMSTLKTEIQTNTSDINTQRNDFAVTYNEVVSEIDSNIDKINKYLIN